MNKPEYCWIHPHQFKEIGVEPVTLWHSQIKGDIQFHITYNEAGDVIRLERVEE